MACNLKFSGVYHITGADYLRTSLILGQVEHYKSRGIDASAEVKKYGGTVQKPCNDIEVKFPDKYDDAFERLLRPSCLGDKFQRMGDFQK